MTFRFVSSIDVTSFAEAVRDLDPPETDDDSLVRIRV